MYIWGKCKKVIPLKKYFFLLVLCSTSLLFAQEKKYQSLLWEISGNGLQKKSKKVTIELNAKELEKDLFYSENIISIKEVDGKTPWQK